jgi:hypothetical protein
VNALFRIHGLLAILMSKYSARWSGGPVFPIKNVQITQMLAHGKIERTIDLPNQLQNYFQIWKVYLISRNWISQNFDIFVLA